MQRIKFSKLLTFIFTLFVVYLVHPAQAPCYYAFFHSLREIVESWKYPMGKCTHNIFLKYANDKDFTSLPANTATVFPNSADNPINETVGLSVLVKVLEGHLILGQALPLAGTLVQGPVRGHRPGQIHPKNVVGSSAHQYGISVKVRV